MPTAPKEAAARHAVSAAIAPRRFPLLRRTMRLYRALILTLLTGLVGAVLLVPLLRDPTRYLTGLRGEWAFALALAAQNPTQTLTAAIIVVALFALSWLSDRAYQREVQVSPLPTAPTLPAAPLDSAPDAMPADQPEPEPILPPPPEVPDELVPYVDASLNRPEYDDYPRSKGRRWLNEMLSKGRLSALVVAYAAFVFSNIVSRFLDSQLITWDVLLPTRLFQLAFMYPWLLALAVVALAALFFFGERAHRDLDREDKVTALREEWRRWQRDKALWERAHQRWAAQQQGLPGREAGAPQGPPFDLGLLPAPDHFVGRVDDLAWVLDRLRAGETTGIAAIGGMGGIGKSALAGVVARQLAAEGAFPDGIAVVLCAGLTDPVEVLRQTLTRFDPRRRAPDANDLPGLAEAARTQLAGKRALVVLDNIEPNWPVEQAIAPLRAAGATVLVTARQRLPGAAVPVAGTRLLDLLAPAEALTLFAQSYGRADAAALSDAERTHAEQIVRELGYHTLAVKLAGAYAATTGRDLGALAAELANPLRALALPEDEAPEKVQRIFAASFDALDGGARRLFAALAAFPTNEFGRLAALALAGTLTLADAEARLNLLVLRALLEASVNETLPAGVSDRERLRLHPLLGAFAATEFARWPAAERTAAERTVAEFYVQYIDGVEDAALVPDEANISGAIEWAHAHGEGELVADLCDGMQYYWRDRGKTSASLRYLPWGIAAAEAAAAQESDDRDKRLRAARLALNYGQILQNTGKLAEAERAFQANLAILREVGHRRGEGAVLTSLGQVARDRGQLDVAQGYFEQSLAILREVGDRQGEGAVLGSLGQVAHARGQLDVAQGYYEQALAIDREVGDRRGEGVDLTSLGQVARLRGQLDAAQDYYEQALAILREVGDRQGEGADLSSLGQVARLRGQLDVAQGYFEQALAIRREVGDRRGEGVDLYSLAQIEEARGNLIRAETLHRESLAIGIEVQSGPDIADSYLELGRFLIEHGRGQPGEGCGLLRAAVRLYHEMGLRDQEDRARARLRAMGCDEGDETAE